MSAFDNDIYDCVVVGLGGHGSASIAHLAKNGLKVVGFEQFDRTHSNGSSHGRSRIYRQAYFEDPKYVPLLQQSLKLWLELHDFYDEELSLLGLDAPYGKNVMTLCGGLMIGDPQSVVVAGTLDSIREHDLPHEVLSSEETRRRWPMMHLADNEIGVYENNAGYLNPEACIEAYLLMAAKYGAELHHNETMINYVVENDYSSSSGSGAWAPAMYGDQLPFELYLERRVLFWFEPIPVQGEDFSTLPVYIWDMGGDLGNFYGFPEQHEYAGQVKVAYHMVDDVRLRVASPTSVNRTVSAQETEEIKSLLQTKIPSLCGKLVDSVTCMYTKTPDEHFLIDFHPEHSNNVVLVSPCSGHGFKFCSVVGEIVADLVQTQTTSYDISLFSIEGRRGGCKGSIKEQHMLRSRL